MRSENEMFALIFSVAEQDERIRAVYLNGSRTNQKGPSDIFQDYDIVFVVTETTSFLADSKWIDVFGQLLMKQESDLMDQMLGIKQDFDSSYTYLMLFDDGNRIDLHIETKENMLKNYLDDKLTVALLDKDGCLPDIPPPTDQDYHVIEPTEADFVSCCNEFWWCIQNVAKGIWREELPYAQQMMELVIRPCLDELVDWWVGKQYNFKLST